MSTFLTSIDDAMNRKGMSIIINVTGNIAVMIPIINTEAPNSSEYMGRMGMIGCHPMVNEKVIQRITLREIVLLVSLPFRYVINRAQLNVLAN